MKYMGSKRAMLGNGLGEAIDSVVPDARRVLDLFTGSAAVAWHVAERHKIKVIACDLQLYSSVLAASVITRTEFITNFDWLEKWFQDAERLLNANSEWQWIKRHQKSLDVLDAAAASRSAGDISLHACDFPIATAYAGYYFSPWQAAWLDALRRNLPVDLQLKRIGLASLVQAASRCAASPGHTAQPFKPNETAGPYLLEAWRRNLPEVVRTSVLGLAARKANVAGQAHCMDALAMAELAEEGDLAFVDPPYSGVHYSRFYHVLESVAQGRIGLVTGVGRYPPNSERPSSDFSIGSKSRKAFGSLLATLSRKGASVIVTFPAGVASNGLAGKDIKEIATIHFQIDEEKVSTRFSTLGGNSKTRAARHDTHELILKLSAR